MIHLSNLLYAFFKYITHSVGLLCDFIKVLFTQKSLYLKTLSLIRKLKYTLKYETFFSYF